MTILVVYFSICYMFCNKRWHSVGKIATWKIYKKYKGHPHWIFKYTFILIIDPIQTVDCFRDLTNVERLKLKNHRRKELEIWCLFVKFICEKFWYGVPLVKILIFPWQPYFDVHVCQVLNSPAVNSTFCRLLVILIGFDYLFWASFGAVINHPSSIAI